MKLVKNRETKSPYSKCQCIPEHIVEDHVSFGVDGAIVALKSSRMVVSKKLQPPTHQLEVIISC